MSSVEAIFRGADICVTARDLQSGELLGTEVCFRKGVKVPIWKLYA